MTGVVAGLVAIIQPHKLEEVKEALVEPSIAAINKGARSGNGAVGDGKIFVLDLADCVRISSGERVSIGVTPFILFIISSGR